MPNLGPPNGSDSRIDRTVAFLFLSPDPAWRESRGCGESYLNCKVSVPKQDNLTKEAHQFPAQGGEGPSCIRLEHRIAIRCRDPGKVRVQGPPQSTFKCAIHGSVVRAPPLGRADATPTASAPISPVRPREALKPAERLRAPPLG